MTPVAPLPLLICSDVHGVLLDNNAQPITIILDELLTFKQNGQQIWMTTDADAQDMNLCNLILTRVTKTPHLFDRIIGKSTFDVFKYEADYWLAFENTTGQPATTVIYLDDNQTNIDNALQHGVHAIKVPEPLREPFKAPPDMCAAYQQQLGDVVTQLRNT